MASPTVGLDKWVIYDDPAVAWDPHPGQLEVVESTARHRVVPAGRRFGKSDIGGHELVPECFKAMYRQDELKRTGKRMEYWIIGPEYSDAEKEFRVLWNILKNLEIPMDHTGPNRSYYDPLGGNMHISCWDGRYQVHAKSAKYPETLVGEGLHGAILAEAAKLKDVVWTKFIRPTLGDFTGWSLHTSTPEGKNHFYDKYQLGQDPDNKEWWSCRKPSWLNPYVYTETGRRIASGDLKHLTIADIPPEEHTITEHVMYMLDIAEQNPGMSLYRIVDEYNLQIDKEVVDLATDMSRPKFMQEIGADFTEFVGQVFKDWDEDYHVGDLHFNPDWETYACCDYGYTNPSVWLLLQVGPWSEINILGEIHQSYLTTEAFATEIRRRATREGIPFNPPQLKVFYPDPARPDSSRELEEKLHIRAVGGTGGELNVRLDLIRKVLKAARVAPDIPAGHPDEFRPQLMVDRSCTRMIDEMGLYKYPEMQVGRQTSRDVFEKPLKENDHAPEALGRFMVGYFGEEYLVGPGAMQKASHAVIRKGKVSPRKSGPKPPRHSRLLSTEPKGYEYKGAGQMSPYANPGSGPAPEVVTINYGDDE